MSVREIKFRGKRIDNGDWVYGYYYTQIITHAGNRKSRDHFMRTEQNIRYEVDPDTDGQYTGLKDKNGKEIYEGDIVRDKKGRHLEVFWKEIGTGGWWFCYNQDGDRYHVDAIHLDYLEVIGNIHDNPELLEGSE